MLTQLEAEFRDCVKKYTLPPLDGSDAAAKYLVEKFAESKKSQIDLPNEAAELIQKCEAISEQLSAITYQK